MGRKVGIIGCGKISRAYITNAKRFPSIEVAACADIDTGVAEAVAREHGLEAVGVDELVGAPEIDIVVNLTVPRAHVPVSTDVVAAGKHVHSEKPLGVARDEAGKLLKLARSKSIRIGCAPDTFLGGGHQTSRKVLDEGRIGRPVAGTAFMMSHGPESWHPNPFFFYEPGAGPLFDFGPYYITALVNLLGPVKSVLAKTTASFEERIATSSYHNGVRIPVSTATHAAGILEFVSGAIITMVLSWDVWGHTHPRIEIYGSEGSMQVPDPNGFGGEVRIKRAGGEWEDVPLTHGYTENNRIIGVVDMASSLAQKRGHRANGELAYHALDVMCAFEESSKTGAGVRVQSTCERPAPLPVGLLPGEID